MMLIPRKKKDQSIERVRPYSSGLPALRDEMRQLFDRFFSEPFSPLSWPGLDFGMHEPRMNLAETDEHVTVTMELPGVDPKDVDVQVSEQLLTVRGEKSDESEDKRKNYHYVERSFGSFQRSIHLPSPVDPDQVDASYKNGVLTVQIAKRPGAKAKRIAVKNG